LVAAFAAAGTTLAVQNWRAEVNFVTAVIGGVVLACTYLVVVVILGVTEDDRLVWDALRGRRRLVTP